MPLATLGLPPLLRDGRPQELALREGYVPRGTSGNLYGDASGVGKVTSPTPEVITWSLVTLRADGESLHHRMAGVCTGWYPSVAKGELQALVEGMEAALVPATYVGDCQNVIDGVADVIPKSLAGSGSPHADLWRRARWLRRDHGPGIEGLKVKAHRSQSQAIDHGDVGLWHGNRYADIVAKGFALKLWEGIREEAETRAAQRNDYLDSMVRGGICARWAPTALDALWLPTVSMRRKRRGARGSQCGEHVLVPRPSGGGQWCSKCKLITRTATSFKTLAAKPCRGEVVLGVHRSHQLRWSVGISWCEKCGYYMSRLPRALRQPCAGAPRSAAARNVLRRLRSGLPPTTAAYLKNVAAEDDWATALEGLFTEELNSSGARSPNGAARGAPTRAQSDNSRRAPAPRDATDDAGSGPRPRGLNPCSGGRASTAPGISQGDGVGSAPRPMIEKVRFHRDELPGDGDRPARRPLALPRG